MAVRGAAQHSVPRNILRLFCCHPFSDTGRARTRRRRPPSLPLQGPYGVRKFGASEVGLVLKLDSLRSRNNSGRVLDSRPPQRCRASFYSHLHHHAQVTPAAVLVIATDVGPRNLKSPRTPHKIHPAFMLICCSPTYRTFSRKAQRQPADVPGVRQISRYTTRPCLPPGTICVGP